MDGPVNVDVVFAKKPPMLNCAIVLASLPSFGRPLYILDGHLKKTVFGRLFIILTAIGLLINFMMAS